MYLTTASTKNLLYHLCGKFGETASGFDVTTSGKCYLGLYTEVPAKDGTGGVEVASPGNNTKNYARVNIGVNGVGNMMNHVYNSHELQRQTTIDDRRIGNTEDINFNVAYNTTILNPDDSDSEAAWGTIKGFGLFNSPTGTDPYAWAEFAVTYIPVTGSSAPTWQADTYYSYNASTSEYELTTSEPQNWATDYLNYFTREDDYVEVREKTSFHIYKGYLELYIDDAGAIFAKGKASVEQA